MAEKIAIMDRGQLQQYGSPDDVYNRPSNRFVAGFVGSTTMNFLPALLDHSGDDLVITLPIADSRPVDRAPPWRRGRQRHVHDGNPPRARRAGRSRLAARRPCARR